MTSTPKSPYAGYRFPGEVISNAIWLYFRFPLSLRMVQEMHLLHHAQAQRKAEVEPNGVADDLARKAIAGVGRLGGRCHAGHLPVAAFPAKPRPKLTVPS